MISHILLAKKPMDSTTFDQVVDASSLLPPLSWGGRQADGRNVFLHLEPLHHRVTPGAAGVPKFRVEWSDKMHFCLNQRCSQEKNASTMKSVFYGDFFCLLDWEMPALTHDVY